jgi:hypothetical protein
VQDGDAAVADERNPSDERPHRAGIRGAVVPGGALERRGRSALTCAHHAARVRDGLAVRRRDLDADEAELLALAQQTRVRHDVLIDRGGR